MGRYYYSKKTEADSLKKIQNWWLKKHGYFDNWGRSGSIKWTNSHTGQESSVGLFTLVHGEDQYLRIYYTQTDENGEKTHFDYRITLTTTKCYFGGHRYWFTCPWYANKVYCGRRVGALYMGGKYFACRHCYNLSYTSNNKSQNKYSLVLDPLFERDKIAEKKANLRVKFWNGKPTKRYQRLENKENIIMGKIIRINKLLT